jgi:hypothetical protein
MGPIAVVAGRLICTHAPGALTVCVTFDVAYGAPITLAPQHRTFAREMAIRSPF